jgi:hypothetical protein
VDDVLGEMFELLDYQTHAYIQLFLPVFSTLLRAIARWYTFPAPPDMPGDNNNKNKSESEPGMDSAGGENMNTEASKGGKSGKGGGARARDPFEAADEHGEAGLEDEDGSAAVSAAADDDSKLPAHVRMAKRVAQKCEHLLSAEEPQLRNMGMCAALHVGWFQCGHVVCVYLHVRCGGAMSVGFG